MSLGTRVYIVLVNWNGWKDTIECLESVCRLDYPDYRVVVCDNDSSNSSVERIAEWAQGSLKADVRNESLRHLSQPPIRKPLQFDLVSAREPAISESPERPPLTILKTGTNGGFAFGCNVGTRYALEDPNCSYVWLLNNDTVVEPDALTALVRATQTSPNLGMCGALCVDYNDPTRVQAVGGVAFNKWTGRVKPVRGLLRQDVEEHCKSHRIDYIDGCSLMLTRPLLEDVGLLHEDYFLFFEEIDLATRAKDKYTMTYAVDAVVYHKQGASSGTAKERSSRSPVSDKFMLRSTLMFGRRFFPLRTPIYLGVALAASSYKLLFGPRKNGIEMLKGIWQGLTA